MKKINFTIIHIVYSLFMLFLLIISEIENMSISDKLFLSLSILFFSTLVKYTLPFIVLSNRIRLMNLMKAIKKISLVILFVSFIISLLAFIYWIMKKQEVDTVIISLMVLPLWLNFYYGSQKVINNLKSK